MKVHYNAIGRETLTGADGVQSPTYPTGKNITAMQWDVEGATVRYFMDGGASPTSSVGHPLYSGSMRFVDFLNFTNLEFYIPTGATVTITFFEA